MKTTKLMLAAIATFLTTWCSLALLGFLLSDTPFKECMTHTATIMCLMMFGWIPSVIVCMDLDERGN